MRTGEHTFDGLYDRPGAVLHSHHDFIDDCIALDVCAIQAFRIITLIEFDREISGAARPPRVDPV